MKIIKTYMNKIYFLIFSLKANIQYSIIDILISFRHWSFFLKMLNFSESNLFLLSLMLNSWSGKFFRKYSQRRFYFNESIICVLKRNKENLVSLYCSLFWKTSIWFWSRIEESQFLIPNYNNLEVKNLEENLVWH
jgi:hypothetical protein